MLVKNSIELWRMFGQDVQFLFLEGIYSLCVLDVLKKDRERQSILHEKY